MLDLIVIRTRYTEVYEGDPVDPDILTEVHEDIDLHEAIRIARNEGVTFGATGTTWAGLPDGSFTRNYATGEQEEVTVHPQGIWPASDYAAFVAGVDAEAGPYVDFGYCSELSTNEEAGQ